MSTEVDVSVFREHRTREELNSLLHYGHIIPVSKGWTRAYVEDHYPGWTWSDHVTGDMPRRVCPVEVPPIGHLAARDCGVPGKGRSRVAARRRQGADRRP